MRLFHFSENPNIPVFRPHIAKTSLIQDAAYVWSIDEWHSPMYFVPRDCPRACFWAGERTTERDRERWLNGLEPRFVMAVEAAWMVRIRSTVLYRYELPTETFTRMDHDGGHYVSRADVVPTHLEPIPDLLAAILAHNVELRVVDRLGPMWRRVHKDSTLHFSGTRLRNAVGYPEEFGVELRPR